MEAHTESELYEIASIFYDVEAQRTPKVFAGLRPLHTYFHELSPSVQKAAVDGLRQRISNETLKGYLERKKCQVGVDAIRPIEDELRERGFLD